MILRVFVLLSALACFVGRADAVPVPRLQLSSPLQTVQTHDERRDVWRSPKNSLKNFPLLGQEDCVRYGRQNGYSECLDGRPEKPASVAEQTPELPAPQEPTLIVRDQQEKPELVAPPVPLQVPLPVRGARILDDKAAPPVHSAVIASEQRSAANAMQVPLPVRSARILDDEASPPMRSAVIAEQTPELSASQERTLIVRDQQEKPELVAPPVPLPVRGARFPDDKAAAPVRSAVIASELRSAVDASVEDPFAKTVGALVVVGFEGRSAADEGPKRIADALRQGRIGGVLLRRANIVNPAQLKALTAFLSRGQDQSPLILIEHSGGPDDGLARAAGFQPVASPRKVGAQGDALQAFNIYRQMAENLATAGVSLNVGPSATACPPDTSAATIDCFGSDPRHSAAFATAFNLAHQSRGVLTAMRYQATAGDDGAALGEMAKRKAPDVLIIGAQTANAPGTKTANTLRPAGFSGAILLDSIDSQDVAEKLVGALNRGADMVLFRTASGLEAGLPDTALERIDLAIDAGRLARARLDDAVSHAASLRQQLQASQSRIVLRAGSAGQGSPTR